MSENMKRWLIGAINSIASGFAAAGGSGIAGISLKQTLIVSGTAATFSFVKWMAQHPIPGGVE